MAAAFQVKGLKELNQFLQQLPAKVEQNVLRGALRAGAMPIRAEAQRRLMMNRSVMSGRLLDSVRVSVRARRGRVTARVVAKGKMNEAFWVEYGTAPHFIEVRSEARPARNTRRGRRTYSIRTINRMVKRGSLVIGQNFVGQSVMHPGARAKPFMRPALDTRARDAVMEAAKYIRRRLAMKHGLTRASEVKLEFA